MDVRSQFSPSGVFLNTASLGLPPARTIEVLGREADRWARGEAGPPDYDVFIDRARSTFAALVGVEESWVSIGSQVSPFIGLIAASVPDGGHVVSFEGEFTSVTFPFLAHARRGVTVDLVPLEAVADAIDDQCDWVAVSAVQSADGRIADLDAIVDAAARHGARVLVDMTQSCGWLPLDASRFDVTVTGAYKWLCCPRGTTFMTVRPGVVPDIIPLWANWYAGADVWTSIYGPPLRLADDARRFDMSPAWLNWAGTAASLDLVAEVGVAAIGAHDLALSMAASEALGIEASDSAILSIDVADIDDLGERLDRAGIAAAMRQGALRVSFHLYNTPDDVEALVAALR